MRGLVRDARIRPGLAEVGLLGIDQGEEDLFQRAAFAALAAEFVHRPERDQSAMVDDADPLDCSSTTLAAIDAAGREKPTARQMARNPRHIKCVRNSDISHTFTLEIPPPLA